MIIKFIMDDLQISWVNDDRNDPEITFIDDKCVVEPANRWACQSVNTLESIIKVIRYINENNMFPVPEE